MALISTIAGLPAVTLEGKLDEKFRQIYFDPTLARLQVFELQLLLLKEYPNGVNLNSKEITLEE